jgi:hypothetical protein
MVPFKKSTLNLYAFLNAQITQRLLTGFEIEIELIATNSDEATQEDKELQAVAKRNS